MKCEPYAYDCEIEPTYRCIRGLNDAVYRATRAMHSFVKSLKNRPLITQVVSYTIEEKSLEGVYKWFLPAGTYRVPVHYDGWDIGDFIVFDDGLGGDVVHTVIGKDTCTVWLDRPLEQPVSLKNGVVN